MANCPSLEDLLRIDSEALDGPTFDALERHLEACPDCRAALQAQLDSRTARDPTRPEPEPIAPPPVPGYRLHRELGRGGMGVVYLATRQEDGLLVALKFLGGGPDERARWRREAEAMRRLDHPGVVRLLELAELGPWTCLVLEHVPGGRLEDRLDGSPSPREAAELVEAVARAIQGVHDAGLLHLDLKPSNILLDAGPDAPLGRSRPQVADFGLALPWGDPEATWTMAAGPRGTPSYMAPEQLSPTRAGVGPAADVYALGAVLYRMLAGRPPVLANSRLESYLQLRDREPVPPRRLNPDVPRALETICLACLRKDPRRRYGSARGLAEDLRRFLDGDRIRQRPTPLPVRAYRWCRRNPGPTAAASALVAALALGMVVMAFRARDARLDALRAEADRAAASQNLDLAAQAAALGFQRRSQSLLFSSDLAAANAEFTDEIILLEARFEGCRISGTIDDSNLLLQGILQREIAQRLVGRRDTDWADVERSRARATFEVLLRLHPGNEHCRRELIFTLLDQLAHRATDSVADVNDAIRMLDEVDRHVRALRDAGDLHFEPAPQISPRLELAERLRRLGEPERARALVAENREILDRLPEDFPADFHLTAATAATEAWLGGPEQGDRLAAEAARMIAEGRISDPRSTFPLRPWFLRPDGPLLPTLDVLRDHPLGVDALGRARAIEDAIDADLARLGLEPPHPPPLRAAASRWLQDLLYGIGTEHRAAGRLAESDHVASVQQAIGNRHAYRQPGDAEAHAQLRLAFLQFAKAEMKREDPDRVYRLLEHAETHARRAVECEPRSATLLRDLQDIRRRLAERTPLAPPDSASGRGE